MEERPNVILSPHYDDAVLSLGGLIGRMPERAVVVTVFAGTPHDVPAGWWDRRSGFADAAAATRSRRAENQAAMALLRVPPTGICDLDFLDRQYRGEEADAAIRSSLRARIGDAVRALIRDRGGAVNLFAPASAWHPDHRLVGDAALAAFANPSCSDADIYLYQDQPYAYLELRRRSLAPLKFADFTALADAVEHRSASIPHREFIEFDSAGAAMKTRAIGTYASQFRVIRPLLCKMIRDFAYYQARTAGAASRYVEVVYRLSRG